MTDLSPAAQAVLDTALDAEFCIEFSDLEATMKASLQRAVAAALQAAADQVVPEQAEPVGDSHDEAREAQWLRIRYKLLAIAAELGNING